MGNQMDLNLLWIIQLAPLAAFLLIQMLPKDAKKIAPGIGAFGALTAVVANLKLFLAHASGAGLPLQFMHNWLPVSDQQLWSGVSTTHTTLVVGFLVDPLNLLMITLVTTISFFVQLFSVYYMEEDPSRPRYFGFLSFFSFSMTGLVLSNNLLQTFLFWELVGLSSYLLIGFWIEKNTAATAARKAFVINRLGDLGFYLGVILLLVFFGTLNFVDLKSEALAKVLSPNLLTVIGILVFTGVMGKSAQFPFHNWLPDAMEGPTPVSALIHSATMVAAGVFLLSRAFGLFSASATTLLTILIIGTLTAFVGASLATIQRDIKRIMAYSTISQLGLMVMAIGAGSPVGGMFHLSTHAYFKSLLFLTAGAFIHQAHSNDIWEIARGGGKKDKLAIAVLCVGLFSLAGIFPFAGFFSKDMILGVLRERSVFFYGVSIFVGFLTVYYSFRLLFVLLFSKINPAHHEAHPVSPPSIRFCKALPLLALASISVVVGALGTPLFGSQILHWLGGHEEHMNTEILLASLFLIVGGVSLAYFQFKNPEAAEQRLESDQSFLKKVLERKFFIDDAYEWIVKQVGLRIAGLMNSFDKTVINGLMVNESSTSVMRLGRLVSRLQNGLLQDYLSLAIGIGVLIIFYFANGVKI